MVRRFPKVSTADIISPRGAFHSMVDASIRQMEVYRELLEAVAKAIGSVSASGRALEKDACPADAL